MPTISEFFGISIYMYWREHGRPHFHAIYGGEEAVIAIDDLAVIEGELSARVRGLVVEWATLHQEELREVWNEARQHQPLTKIEPLR
ncbi:DUF4160 domain-containing protein [soil metagenome]